MQSKNMAARRIVHMLLIACQAQKNINEFNMFPFYFVVPVLTTLMSGISLEFASFTNVENPRGLFTQF
jgi:hypothetical protein